MTTDLGHRLTQRLLLRRPCRSDLDFLVALFSRPELVAHRPDPHPDAPDVSAARLVRDMAHWEAHGFGRWAVLCDDKLVGFGGLTVSKSGLEGLNLSYHLHPEQWGRGYASEIVSEALQVAFGELNASRVIGLVRPANPASRKVLERAGFTFDTELSLDGAPTMRFTLDRPVAAGR